MSDRFQKITVALDREYSEEALKPILAAIRMVKGVAAVKLGEPLSGPDWIAKETVLREFVGDLFTILSVSPGRDDKDTWGEIAAIAEAARKKRGY